MDTMPVSPGNTASRKIRWHVTCFDLTMTCHKINNNSLSLFIGFNVVAGLLLWPLKQVIAQISFCPRFKIRQG